MYVCYTPHIQYGRTKAIFQEFCFGPRFCTPGQTMLQNPHFRPFDGSKANFGINAGRGLKDLPEPRGQTMLQKVASGCFKSQDREGFSERVTRRIFGALVLRAGVEIRSGRPKPACWRNIPRRSTAGRGNSTRS